MAGKESSKSSTTLGVIFLFMAGLFGFLGYSFLLSMKDTPLYNCALSEARKSAVIHEQIGKEFAPGMLVWLSSYESGGSVEQAHFSTGLTGPNGEGTLYIDSYKSPLGSSFSLKLETSGGSSTVYQGPYPCS